MWYNDLGQELELPNITPKMLKWHVQRTYERDLQKKLAGKWDDPDLKGRIGPDDDPQARAKRVDIHMAKQLLRSEGFDGHGRRARKPLQNHHV